MLLVILLSSIFHLAWSNSGSTSIEDMSIEDISIEDTSTEELPDWSCGFGYKGYNCFPNETKICYLGSDSSYSCRGFPLTTLPTSIYVYSACKYLSFQHTRLTSLKVETFLKADGVEELVLSDNAINSIDNDTFAPFISLTHLRLSRNKLSKVTLGMLNGLWNLRLLELGHNNIESISPLIFRETPNLEELRLQFNPLFRLPADLFRFVIRLKKLDLQNTGLLELPSNIFRPIPLLLWLSLATNQFENVPKKALYHAAELQRLDLSENNFKMLSKGTFKRQSHLLMLYLNHLDRLTWIEEGAFAGLVNLNFLSCSYNSKLNYIDEYVFGSKLSNSSAFKTPQVENLYLRLNQNALRTLKSPVEEKFLSSLGFVALSENPWKCDCNLKWMLHLKKETQANIRCDSPPKLQGRTFDTLDPSDLICGRDWTLTLIVVSAVAFVLIVLAVSAVVCSRTRLRLYKRAKQHFSYDKMKPKADIEKVDFEWDPSADKLKNGSS